MKSSTVAAAAATVLASTVGAQSTTAAPQVPDSSFYSVFKTGVPSSIISLILTNPGEASTVISDGYTAGTTFYAGSFPADVQSSLKNPSWRATNQIFNNPALLTATTPVSIPTTPFSSPARTTAPPSNVPDSSFYSVFKTGVPSSIISLILTNPAAASTVISAGYTAGTTFYAGSFPADVQSSLKNPSWRATNQIFNNPALLTATTPVSIPTTPFSTPARATTTPGAASNAPSSTSGAFTGGAAAAPTAAIGAGAAFAAGLVGMLAL